MLRGQLKLVSAVFWVAFLAATAMAQTGAPQGASPAPDTQKEIDKGKRKPGRLAKFDQNGRMESANITEDPTGRIGINATMPTSPLTVNGVVETVGPQGGIKFPDGTVQQTAASSTIVRDNTLKGTGTQASPLGVAVPLKLNTFV